MSHSRKPGAVIYAKDLGRMTRFYTQLLALTVVHSEADHAVLESADWQLVVHAIPAAIAETVAITTPPERRGDTPIKLRFAVASIAAARETAATLGGELDPPEREWLWQAQQLRVCDGCDPEGNVLQLQQLLN